MTASHACPVTAAAGGLIKSSWCFDSMASALSDMPPILTQDDVLHPKLLLAESEALSIRYCPFDWVNPGAEVVIIGITPGLYQMYLSCQEAQRALAEGSTAKEALRRACNVGSFAGPMRTNLIAMLDAIGLQRRLGIESTATLFDGDSGLLHSTSAVLYPAFLKGENYGGSPPVERYPLLRAFTDQVLTAELAMSPEAVIIPLGKAVSQILRRQVERKAIEPERVLFDFPHPSGGNGHRVRQFELRRRDLETQLAAWPVSR